MTYSEHELEFTFAKNMGPESRSGRQLGPILFTVCGTLRRNKQKSEIAPMRIVHGDQFDRLYTAD